MRVGVVIDSGCDLPPDFIEAHKLGILPITIHLDGKDLVDQRDPGVALDFYKNHRGTSAGAATSAFTAEQITAFVLERLVLDFDFVFCLTIASSRSLIHANAVKASFAILNEYKPIRARAGITTPFALRVIDTQNLFAGQAITAFEAVRMIKLGAHPNQIRDRLDQLAPNTYGYMIPRDLKYLRERAQSKGDRSVGWLSATLGTALDIKPVLRAYQNDTGPVAKIKGFDVAAARLLSFTVARVEKGLLAPVVALSFGGELARMRALPGYADLRLVCSRLGVEIIESVMGVTGGINVGEGALAVAFASEPHEADI
jgi:DegV family protein with EDD domain